MKYQCNKCHETFIHPAIKITSINENPTRVIGTLAIQGDTLETHQCPFCQSLTYTEITESEPQVEAVYVYDLTSGPQTELTGLLAQGYEIVGRYAKQYILEKKKEEVKKEQC